MEYHNWCLCSCFTIPCLAEANGNWNLSRCFPSLLYGRKAEISRDVKLHFRSFHPISKMQVATSNSSMFQPSDILPSFLNIWNVGRAAVPLPVNKQDIPVFIRIPRHHSMQMYLKVHSEIMNVGELHWVHVLQYYIDLCLHPNLNVKAWHKGKTLISLEV